MQQLSDQKAAFEEQLRDEYLRLKERQDGLLGQIHETEVFNSQVVKDHVDALATQELEERRK